MSLTLGANTLAVAPAVSTYFGASGGTAPYVFSILPNGAGGSINPSTGKYTAPNILNNDPELQSDNVQVTDAAGAVATLKITVMSPILLVCDIIRQEMELTNDQCYLYDQKINIPKDSRLYIAVGVLQPRPFGNSTKLQSDGTVVQSVNMRVLLSIEILSRSTDALNRKEEILLALKSIYAQQQMTANTFFIAPLTTSFVALNEIDGPAIPYRFNLSVNMQYFVKKIKPVPYFDTFQQPTTAFDPS